MHQHVVTPANLRHWPHLSLHLRPYRGHTEQLSLLRHLTIRIDLITSVKLVIGGFMTRCPSCPNPSHLYEFRNGFRRHPFLTPRSQIHFEQESILFDWASSFANSIPKFFMDKEVWTQTQTPYKCVISWFFKTIDGKELETILDSSQMLFTKDQVNEILKSIDNDNTESLDFFECLEVRRSSVFLEVIDMDCDK